MMNKLTTTIFLFCMAFVIIPNGCDGHTCSDASLNSCGEIYHTTRVAFGQRAQACSGTTTSVTCINQVIADCIIRPPIPKYTSVKNLAMFKIRTFKQMGCVEYKPPISGGGRVKTSLLISAVAFMFVVILC